MKKIKITTEQKRIAKFISMKMWWWLYQNPAKYKEDLPDDIKKQLAGGGCLLCDLFNNINYTCLGCPLDKAGQKCLNANSFHDVWWDSGDDLKKKVAALGIFKIIRDWKI